MFRLFLILSLLPSIAWSQSNSFHQGIAAFKKENFKQAVTDFEAALKEQPDQPQILFNLGLTHQKLGQKGRALALWRKALTQDPYFGKAKKALSTLEKNSPSSLWENFHSYFLSYLPFNLLLALFLLSLALLGFALINHLALIQKSRNDEYSPSPGFPLKLSLFSLLFLVSLTLTLSKTYDHFEPRGTIVQANISLLVSPNSESLELTKINEGLEVILKKTFEDWIQVQIPSGPSGWTQKANIIQTRGRQL